MSKNFQEGKLYYYCSWSLGPYPVPELEAYILKEISDEGMYFEGPEGINAQKVLSKLNEDERCSLLNIMSIKSLFVPHDELETNMYSPKEAETFFRDGLSGKKIKSLL